MHNQCTHALQPMFLAMFYIFHSFVQVMVQFTISLNNGYDTNVHHLGVHWETRVLTKSLTVVLGIALVYLLYPYWLLKVMASIIYAFTNVLYNSKYTITDSLFYLTCKILSFIILVMVCDLYVQWCIVIFSQWMQAQWIEHSKNFHLDCSRFLNFLI